MANAARLGAIAAACLLAVAIGGLALFGQLDDVGDLAISKAQSRLAQMGFAVDSVDITGAEGEVAHSIAAATGIYRGQSIFAVDPEVVRLRVEALPLVRSATVARLWPNRIAVVVETRDAYALWQVNGTLNVIDREGVVIAPADLAEPPELPLVVAIGANDTVVEIVEALGLHPIIGDRVIGAIRVGNRRWNLRLDNGADVKLPELDMRAAIALLATLQADRGILGLNAASFDLRGEGNIIVRPRTDIAPAERRA